MDGVVCQTYREAARLRGLLADDSAWIESITEAARVRMPRELRRLFVLILVFCTPSDPLAIWDRFWEELSDDFVRTHGELAGKDAALRQIQFFLIEHNMTCRDVGLPTPSPLENMNTADYSTNEFTINFEAEQAVGEQLRSQLNAGQETAVAEILAAVLGFDNARCFFLDGPGGTGKTFVYNSLARILRGQERRVVLVATTGIAATLLPGGRTAH